MDVTEQPWLVSFSYMESFREKPQKAARGRQSAIYRNGGENLGEILLELKNIDKHFGKEANVLNKLSLAIEKGEFITFLGASGCGKTTTLRIIAGLEEPDGGQVFLKGLDVTSVEPNHRDVNTVFQNYALFPHMNVAENVGYGLKLRRIPKKEIQKRVSEMLELVQLPGYEKRRPDQLSGGQKQRVAIARALINRPSVLLLDEPLGALDANLRRMMQTELKKLQKKLGITFVYITHDQEEAINMSDRIAVMRSGQIEQLGTPDEIYNYPKTSYVAQFVGNANILEGRVLRVEGDTALVRVCAGEAFVSLNTHRVQEGDFIRFAVRSENIRLFEENRPNALCAAVTEKAFAGGQLRLGLLTEDGTTLTASRYGIDANVQEGQRICFAWDAKQAVLVDWEDVNEK